MRLWSLLLAPFRRGPRGPLAARQPVMDDPTGDVPLGFEGLDMEQVEAANRRNDALERVSFGFGRKSFGSFAQNASTRVRKMPEDQTYAAAYHRAFQRKETSK